MRFSNAYRNFGRESVVPGMKLMKTVFGRRNSGRCWKIGRVMAAFMVGGILLLAFQLRGFGVAVLTFLSERVATQSGEASILGMGQLARFSLLLPLLVLGRSNGS